MQRVGRSLCIDPAAQKSPGFVPLAAGSRQSDGKTIAAMLESCGTQTREISLNPSRNVDVDQNAHSERLLNVCCRREEERKVPSVPSGPDQTAGLVLQRSATTSSMTSATFAAIIEEQEQSKSSFRRISADTFSQTVLIYLKTTTNKSMTQIKRLI
ncbi:hypothetical protein XENOCAPTIV_017813 [Xenoophorus captivus]|uniref:Uncharacterized protein n=1 Tax=Xenoophorus captivus TaxID=1517983 RepID=A0ABV0RAY0_9TELE